MTATAPRSVVVTGCGAGIGRAILERLARDGWFAVGIELDDATASEVRELLGARGDVIGGDVTSRTTLEAAARRARELAPLGGWVNNAGIVIGGAIHEAKEADVEKLFDVDLFAVFWGCAVAVQSFVDQRSPGSIVNISSIHGRTAFPGWAAYATAKGGVDALTRYLAVEYGPVGIRSNAIAPGAIHTPLMERTLAASPDRASVEKEFARLHPLERTGEPAEIAAVAAFLLSDEASFVSGQSIAVDGGATARCYAYDADTGLLEAYAETS